MFFIPTLLLLQAYLYDGLTFHRIIADFMMQSGDPLGDGTGGPDEREVISMARAQDPNSASSQFFICHADSDFLDGDYAAFGKVVKGIDVVDKVCKEAQPTDGNGSIGPAAQPVMKSVKIRVE